MIKPRPQESVTKDTGGVRRNIIHLFQVKVWENQGLKQTQNIRYYIEKESASDQMTADRREIC
jgi:hypothetical protein